MAECKDFCIQVLSKITSYDKDTVGLTDKKTPKAGVTVTAKEQTDALDGAVGKEKSKTLRKCPTPDKGKNCDCKAVITQWDTAPEKKKVHVPLTKDGNEYDVTAKGEVLFGLALGYCDDKSDDYYASAIGVLPDLNLTVSLDTQSGENIPGEVVSLLEKQLEKGATPKRAKG